MSDLEEQLLDSDEEEAPKPKRENSTIKQMREALDAQKAELEAARERAAKYETTFLAQSGLTEKQAAVLRAGGYEATPEGIDAFRSEVIGAQPPASAEEPPAEQEQVEEEVEAEEPKVPFQPTAAGSTTPAKREVTSNELLDMFQTDPVKADKLLRSGRVVRKEFNPGGPEF